MSLEFFTDIKSFRSHYGPGVDSASNRNEYQEHFPRGKGGRCVRLTTIQPSCAVVRKSGNLNFLEPSGPLQACNGTDLPFTRNIQAARQSAPQQGLYSMEFVRYNEATERGTSRIGTLDSCCEPSPLPQISFPSIHPTPSHKTILFTRILVVKIIDNPK